MADILAGFLQLLNAIADASGFLVVFLCHQSLKFLPQLRELGLGSLGAGCSTRGFAGVPGFSMNAFEEWKQLRFEDIVIAGASESTVVAELQE
jgi:hypothetical protein